MIAHQDPLPDLFAERCAAGLAGDDNLLTGGHEQLFQVSEVGGFTDSLQSFESNECATHYD